jgi:DNA-binding winged helix-turn-helix (wHTH) protein/TolB-like protein/Tfp pilus assembly protein PilF
MCNQLQRRFSFAEFQVDPTKRQLLREGKPVNIKSKTFDLLLVLVENNGRVVEKDELMNTIWQGQFVEEGNLTVQISALRKVLGETKNENRFLVTVPGKGYRFIADIREEEEEETEIIIANRTTAHVVVDEEIEVGQRQKEKYSPLKIALATSALVLLTVCGMALYRYLSKPTEKIPSAKIDSIAVLPFKPLVLNERDESLEMGITETLITRLSNLKQLSVRSMNAVKKYNRQEQDSATIGKELKVEAVLDGSIQKTNDRIRVTVRLLRVSDNQPFWTEQFDEKFTDIFTVQDRVASRVAESLRVVLTNSEQKLLAKRYTENSESYRAYLRGRYHWNKRTSEGLQKSIEDFREAIDLDPLFALAYIGLADSYILQSLYGAKPAQDVMPKARTAANKALEIDSQLAEAHASLALVKFLFDYDWVGAENGFKKAVELKPNYATGQQWYGNYLTMAGRHEEAIAALHRASELDPLSLSINTDVALAYYFARKHNDAIKQLNKTLELDKNFFMAHFHLGLNYAQQKSFEKAIAEFEIVKNETANEQGIAELAWVYALSGQKDKAREILKVIETNSQNKRTSLATIAGVYAALGDKGKAFDWLDKAYETRDGFLVSIKVDPIFDSLRDESRYQELLRQMNLKVE